MCLLTSAGTGPRCKAQLCGGMRKWIRDEMPAVRHQARSPRAAGTNDTISVLHTVRCVALLVRAVVRAGCNRQRPPCRPRALVHLCEEAEACAHKKIENGDSQASQASRQPDHVSQESPQARPRSKRAAKRCVELPNAKRCETSGLEAART